MDILSVILALALADQSTSSRVNEAPKKVEETMVVTATRSERTVSDLPISTTVIDQKSIESAPARSVDDLIRTIPGVMPSIVSGSGSTPNNQRITMRGLSGTRALVLLDGIPLHDPYSGVAQWQKVSLDDLDQVEVVRGGNASLFGNFALGGTINLITRPVEDNRITLDLSGGTGQTQQQRLSFDRVINPRVALRASYDRIDSNGYMRVPNTGPIDTRAWVDNWIAAGRADLTFSDTSRAFVKTSLAQVDISQGTPISYSKRDILESSAGLHHGTGANSILSASAFYQRQKERLVNSTIIGNDRIGEFLTQDGTIPSNVFGGALEWSVQRGGKIPFLSMGLDLRKSEAFEDRTSFSRTGAVTQRNRVGGEQTSAGLFVQTSWRPTSRFEVLTSARVDLFRNGNGSDVIVGGEAIRYPSTSSTQIDPRVSLRYAVSSNVAVRASFYRAFAAPTLRDLYRKNQSGTSVILGNPYLKPETLTGGEIGWEWAGDHGRVEVNLFRSTIDSIQSRTRVPGQPANVTQAMNLGSARSQGLELIANAHLSQRWSLNAGYTYADATVLDDPDPALVGNQLTEMSKHTGALGIRFRGHRGTTIDGRGRVLSRAYGDIGNVAVSPAHRVVDLSVTQRITPSIDAYATLENVFDEKYWQAFTTTSFRSGLPRTFSAGVRLKVRGANR